MLAPQLRQQIFQLWTAFWSSGMTNPITAIEQITYLLFLKQLEQQDKEQVEKGNISIYEDHENCRWSRFFKEEQPYETLTAQVFPWLRTLGDTIQQKWGNSGTERLQVTEYLEDAYFQLAKEKTATLRTALDAVNKMFDSTNSQNADLMGDIFEYLLDQLSTSGKNGQFRTPRHIIRFMIELLNPAEGSRIIDPAGGTAGFLTNTVLHHRQNRIPKEQRRIEWDGTPHNLSNEYHPKPEEFNGFDNDRTMVRIGWMNMVLHGIAEPRYRQHDPLSKSLNNAEKGQYDYAFANPPYSGNIDEKDLHENYKNKGTTSSELLFVYLLLDLLKPGGKMAVIVPEGLLFGSTNANKELRKTLLYDHIVEGIISLPQGVFNPYTGVKTSILIVQKGNDEAKRDIEPKTKKVWFYEVQKDGFTLGANRNPEQEKPNDLWDALQKWNKRNDENAIELDTREGAYYKPKILLERWRLLDDRFEKLFPDLKPITQILPIHKIFTDLLPNQNGAIDLPKAEANTIVKGETFYPELFKQMALREKIVEKADFEPVQITDDQIRDILNRLRRLISTKAKEVLEQREGIGSQAEEHGMAVLTESLDANLSLEISDETVQRVSAAFKKMNKTDLVAWLEKNKPKPVKPVKIKPSKPETVVDQVQEPSEPEQPQPEPVTTEPIPPEKVPLEPVKLEPVDALPLLKLFAQLDGYSIYMQHSDAIRHKHVLTEPNCWIVAVETWRENKNWKAPSKPAPKTKGKKTQEENPKDTDPPIIGSHDENGNERPEYTVAAIEPKTRFLKSDFLDSECIAANDYNLSANRYKPLQLLNEVIDAGATAKLLEDLLKMENGIRSELEKLLGMIKGTQ
jgi:type I restriction enzyme M protein